MAERKRVYMVAVGGVGMSALAGLFVQAGWEVAGSDGALYPPVSDYLRDLGIRVSTPYDGESVPRGWDLYVVGNAVTRDNPEAVRLREMGVSAESLPSALYSCFLKGKRRVVVAGTHGKTTTASMAAFALRESGRDPSHFVGGIAEDLGGPSRLGSGEFFVVEGDEYDSAYFDKRPKFFHYRPHHLLITSVEFDHADIYRDVGEVESAFRELVRHMPQEGTVVACVDFPLVREVVSGAPCRVVTISRRGDSDAVLVGCETGRGFVKGSFLYGGREWEVSLRVPGVHNLINAFSACLVLETAGVPLEETLPSLSRFRGVARRQMLLGEAGGVIVVDDFAHHPTAVAETIRAVREFYSPRRLVAVFEPRSNTSRRRIFEKEFVRALGEADAAVVAPPYRAERIPEEERFDPSRVAGAIKMGGKEAFSFSAREEIPPFLAEYLREGDLVLFMSNGDFGGIQWETLRLLRDKEGKHHD
ncbi:MAG: UDP-N-acetylmuramate:L-alanyl-gamma-D-glutamyl-meso-diaminopimelate ligase [Deltaproteobacteria bacterium]|nr:MAG: UDP-N-acetylmuramate:L-alanyl-gamma-D-glutamyl-meso-diaminopimelate ligase [Deltaproteobacteria bacterium]